MDPLTMASLGIQGVTGLISTVNGLFQKARANRLAKLNVRPVYNIPGEIKTNQQMAQQMSKQGMSSQQYGQQTQAIGRNANAALSNAQDRRGGLAAIGAIQQNSNDANLNLNVQDNNMRLNNIRNLMQQNSTMAQFKDKAFAWNKQAKFQENAAAIRALQGAGNANIDTGLNALGSMGTTAMAMGDLGDGTTPLTPYQKMEKASILSASGAPKGWAAGATPNNDAQSRLRRAGIIN